MALFFRLYLKLCVVKNVLLFIQLLLFASILQAQKIDSITFNLYTDSLKKGFYNYINVDGRFDNGRWLPLSAEDVTFTSNAGTFNGNDLFIDSAYTGDSVWVKATVKNNPQLWKEVIIYIRKRPFTELLKTNEEVINEYKQQPVRHKNKKEKTKNSS